MKTDSKEKNDIQHMVSVKNIFSKSTINLINFKIKCNNK